MSSYARETLPARPGMAHTSWPGVIAENVADFPDRVQVIIPAFDTTLQWGPCRWQARDAVTTPLRGDPCLVTFAADGEPYVVFWWPEGFE